MTYNQKATKTYQRVQEQIKEQIKALQSTLDRHNAQAVQVDWSDVGDIESLSAELERLNTELSDDIKFKPSDGEE